MSGRHSRRGGGGSHQRGGRRNHQRGHGGGSGGAQPSQHRDSSSGNGETTGGRHVPFRGHQGRVYGRGATSNTSQTPQAPPSGQSNSSRRQHQLEHSTHPRTSSQQPRHSSTPHRPVWSKEEIEAILRSSSDSIIDKASNERCVFLNTYRLYDTDFYMKKLIKLLMLLTGSTRPELAGGLMSEIFQNCDKFMMKLNAFILNRQFSLEKDTSLHLHWLVQLGEFCVRNIPQSSMFAFPISQLKQCITKTVSESPENQEFRRLLQAVTNLDAEFDKVRVEYMRIARESAKVPTTEEKPNPHNCPPPDDFRQIQILPTVNEIKDNNRKPFLRPNIVKGVYHDWDHYLDVQFRLLREDFMQPLRDGIHGYLHGTQKNRDVLVYEGVHVLNPICLHAGVGFIVKFDLERSRLTRVRWEHSRKLIFGSLVCLSQDNFQNIIFGSVVKRDPELLQQGQVVIKFEGDTNVFDIDPSTEFLMVESTAYFEAYRHVLEALQGLSVDQLCFKPYIVGGFQVVKEPFYFRCDPTLDLNLTLGLKVARRSLPVTAKSLWPKAEETCLDKSQLNALQMALSQELSVIQGPPGTGKTYIGLKIVQALLQNHHKWNPSGSTPILVVCYTNHALDQFLSGIVSDCRVGQLVPKIVRVGGRCKSEEIKCLALANLVTQLRTDHKVPSRFYKTRRALQTEVKELQESMENLSKSLDSESKLLSIDELRGVMDPVHYSQLVALCLTGSDAGRELECWLGLWYASDYLAEPSLPQQEGMNEEDQTTAAMEASLLQQEKAELAMEESGEGEVEVLIDVEDEPQLIEDDRILEGEDDFFVQPIPEKKEATASSSSHPTSTASKKDSDGWQVKQPSSKEKRWKITKGLKCKAMQSHYVKHVTDIWQLSDQQKWKLYKFWKNQHTVARKQMLQKKSQDYNILCQTLQNLDREINLLAFEGAHVIGMTTTGAAKHSYILKRLNPKIVIVEEAAEVFDSHIVTSVSANTQQLVLIGDHKQLRPKPTSYELGKKYNFDVSLFERLASNDFPVATLEVQHRMRPEIASIVAKHIYDGKLENHKTVHEYHAVRGVSKNLYFVDHSQPEKDNPTGDMRSHANSFEANYLVSLCRYLLKQGYLPTDITLLTMYRGQLLELKQKMQRKDFHGVRVAAVDDFQGEENKIILVSLVRSNNEGKIGFLKIENRICVALSRAKEGMFVIGNLTMLRDKDDTKWPAILRDLEKEEYVGEGLPLQCQIHSKAVIYAKDPSDFSRCPEGGCSAQCGIRLDCGHVCRSPCHPLDREHKRIYKCQQQCDKRLSCGHPCQQKCCHCRDKGCLPCTTRVKKRAKCGHYQEMKCSQDLREFECMKQCEEFLECGHRCQARCSEPHTTRCTKIVPVPMLCGHKVSAECHMKTKLKCPVPCKALLQCDHYCSGTCSDCHKGRLHVRCNNDCGRTLACGHICDFPCTANCPPCSLPCGNYCQHSKCPKKCYEPCVPCQEPCQWRCQHYTCPNPCGRHCSRPRCDAPCQKKLKCGHKCIGLCGEECPTLCGTCDPKDVYSIFFGTEEPEAKFIQLKDCGHMFEVSGMDRWMEEAQGDPQEIKFKECPRCKVPIRRSHRYGNIVKKTLKDMEEIKQRSVGSGENFLQKINELKTAVSKVAAGVKICEHKSAMELIERIQQHLSDRPGWKVKDGPWLSPHKINTIENQLVFIPQIAKVYKSLCSSGPSSLCFVACKIMPFDHVEEVQALTKFLNVDYLTDQQLHDAHCEFRRLSCLSKLCELKKAALGRTLSDQDELSVSLIAKGLLECGWRKPPMTPGEEETINGQLQKLTEHYKLGPLTQQERMEIVEAVGLSKGHWFKCPNEHYYCIGECGGATQEGKCPDCGAIIGGTNHTLRADNALAGEMDGAEYAAWSQAANMANFDLDNLR